MTRALADRRILTFVTISIGLLLAEVALLAQTGPMEVAQLPPVADRGLDVLGTQFIISGLAAYLLEHLKNSTWMKWFTPETSRKTKQVIAILVSGVTALGIHWSYDGTAGTLTITGLTAAAVVEHGWDWLRAWYLQQLVYDIAVKESSVAKDPSVRP